MRRGWTAVWVAGTAVAAAAADPFVRFADIPAAERLPRDAALAVAADGTFRVNGEPRYLTATIFYGGAKEFKIRTSGYGPDLHWLYEGIPGYEGMQRIGVDAVGFEAGREWMKEISPTAAEKWKMSGCLPADDDFAPAFAGQLPAYVDFTAAEWGHGGILAKDNPRIPVEAWTVGENHWVPYSILHPDGRRFWLTMWREGVKRYARLPVKPYCYELMNEPAVYDTGDYAKARFRETGRTDHPVEYLKFMDESYAALIAEGVKAVHELQPGARVTLQPLGHFAKGIDRYALYRMLDLVCSQTGGGGIPTAHLLRAVADGKPIVDGETYIGTTALSVRNALVKQYQRGFNASYTFKWSRRPRDWARKGDAAAEEPLAKKVASYNFLIPYVVPTEALTGFRLARRDAMDVGAFFLPRDRGTPRRIAVLYSKPTERLASLNRSVAIQLFDKVVDELEYAHLNPDAIYEEQLRDEPERLGRYDVLVAPGVEAVFPWTPAAVRAWQAKGGRLVQVGERMAKDEYGRPNGETYPGAAFVAAEGVAADELGRRLAAEAGVKPMCETRGAEKVEVTDACRDGLRAWIVTSRAVAPQAVRFRPAIGGEMTILVRNVRRDDGKIVSTRRELLPDGDGCFPLFLRPDDANILVAGPRDRVTVRYPKADDAEWLPALSAADAAAEAEKGLAEYRRVRLTKKGGYHLEPNRTRQLDLRERANERRLSERHWGLHEVEGVPFDFIRSDQNLGRDTVAPGSGEEVEVPLAGKALHVYFAYAGKPAFTLRRADGTVERFAAPAGEEGTMRVWRWTNPRCDRDLAGLSVRSDGEGTKLYAVTLEAPADGTRPIGPELVKGFLNFSGPRLAPVYTNATLELTHGETPSSWSGGRLVFRRPVKIPADWKDACFALEVNKRPNRYGKFAAAPSVQIKVVGGYVTPRTDDRLTGFAGADDDPASWETLYVFFDPSRLKDGEVKEVAIQYKMIGAADPSALAFRNLRFVRGECR